MMAKGKFGSPRPGGNVHDTNCFVMGCCHRYEGESTLLQVILAEIFERFDVLVSFRAMGGAGHNSHMIWQEASVQ